MSPLTRRTFLGSAAALGAALGLESVSGLSPRAEAATTGTITDVQHVVVLMQENRSFDHYFGSLQGVRGFADRSAIAVAGGYSVFDQPNGSARQYPWQLSDTAAADSQTPEILAQCDGSLDHGWSTQHEAWDSGKMDDWVSAKGSVRTMGYLDRSDIPFHYALADAYTVCDAYHCSILSATGPNRTYLWSGMIDPTGTAGGPAYDGGSESGLKWQTYAETLQNAGVSWKVYQNASDNFSDNGLAFFSQFANAATGSTLYERGMASVPSTGNTPVDIANAIAADAKAGTLPQVSWVVANQNTSEHPDAPPGNGAYFIDLVLQALASNSAVLDSTVLFLNYDENDGFFDHVPPPAAPSGTTGEFYDGVNVGLGFRVPMVVVSPWSRGGWVDSQVYDHTSVIRFMESWTTALGTPALCPNISAWRREVCGDLTGAFNFASPVYGLPTTLPSTAIVMSQPDCDPLPDPGPETNALPTQESGTRPARALPYQPNGSVDHFEFDASNKILLWLKMSNEGAVATSAAHFAVYANANRSGGPWQYTVPAYNASTQTNGTAGDYYNIGSGYGNGAYDFTMIGPNRFLRHFAGNATTIGKNLETTSSYAVTSSTGDLAVWFTMTNAAASGKSAVFTITSNNYRSDGPWTYTVPAGGSASDYFNAVAYCNGWYDFTVTNSLDSSWSRRFTGHLETGSSSITG